MKVVAAPIDVLSWANTEGVIVPIRFRIENPDKSLVTVSIDKVIDCKLERLGGNPMLVFTCKINQNDVQKICILKYEKSTCKWMLFKI